jgi:hypothetical protein
MAAPPSAQTSPDEKAPLAAERDELDQFSLVLAAEYLINTPGNVALRSRRTVVRMYDSTRTVTCPEANRFHQAAVAGIA